MGNKPKPGVNPETLRTAVIASLFLWALFGLGVWSVASGRWWLLVADGALAAAGVLVVRWAVK